MKKSEETAKGKECVRKTLRKGPKGTKADRMKSVCRSALKC